MVGFAMSVLNLNYDRKFDILYARLSGYSPSYGEEDNGVVTFFSIDTDAITGMAIYKAKERVLNNDLDPECLPIPIDLNSAPIKNLLYNPEDGYTATLPLA